jgi:hypothetical protein
MLTDAQKAARLRQAMDHMEDAEELIKLALGDSDAGVDLRHMLEAAIEEIMYDIIELESENDYC